MRRGRPPYPDLLTPREQEVLALIREGLTNDQIAARLGISESGARYHVSEILSKLNVTSRREAAQWDGRTGWLSKLGLVLPHIGLQKAMTAFVATGVVAVVALAIGVLIMQGRDKSEVSREVPPTVVVDTVDQIGLHQQLLSDADNLYRVTRSVLSEPAACQCLPTEVEVLRHSAPNSCKAVGREILQSPEYDAARDEPLATGLIISCEQLQSITEPSGFVPVATDIAIRLEPILVAEHAKTPSRPQGVPAIPAARSKNTPSNVYAPPTRVGIPAVDRTLDLIERNRWDQLASQAAYRDMPCSFDMTREGLKCGLAEPEGTTHPVVLIGACEASPVERPLVESALSTLSDAFLYAAFKTDHAWASDTRYILLFRSPSVPNDDRQLLLDQSGRVTGFGRCGVVDWLPADGDTTILPRKQ
jgi:DNA-binding CsgD family transcriptional regulator